jgi:WD40 repeat protein
MSFLCRLAKMDASRSVGILRDLQGVEVRQENSKIQPMNGLFFPLQIWKHDGDCVTVWGSRKGIVDCHFIDKETQLLTCGADGSIRTWRVDRGQPIAVLLSDVGLHVICFDRSADSLTLAQGTSTHGLQLISVSSDLVCR